MRNKLISLKKALFGGMAFVMAATLVAPASPVLAAEIETQTEASESGAQAQTDIGKSTADTAASSQAAGAQAAESDTAVREATLKVTNRTTGRPDAMTVKEPVVSDIEAPEAGKRLDDKALVTTAEKEQWEVPVLWVSSDGQVQQYHYDTSNSPLPSNTVNDIAVNPVTGEVAVATMAGLALLKTGEVPAAESLDYDNILIYPNPVVPGYHGLITITGLTYNADVKICASNGALVAEGRSSGGMFTWDGCDMKGKRVASGVYMVQTAKADGSKGVVCKIAIVN